MFAYRAASIPKRARWMHRAVGLRSEAFEIPSRARLGTGVVELDGLLGGGLPCGAVTELVGAESSGKTSLACAVTAAVTATGALAAWIDLPNALDPEHARLAGVRLAQLLWIRPPDLQVALRAAERVLKAGGFRLVLLDLALPRRQHRTPPPAVWLRLGRAARWSGAAVVAVVGEVQVGSFAALRLEVLHRQAVFSGEGEPCPLFEGLAGEIRLRKSKLDVPAMVGVRVFVSAAV